MMRRARQQRFIIKILDFVVPLGLICLEIVLNLLCVGTAINGFLLVLLFTSPLWVMLVICWWPMLLFIAILLHFSSLRVYLQRITT